MEILTKSGFEREIERNHNLQEHFQASSYFNDNDKKEIANHFQELNRFFNLGIAVIITKQFKINEILVKDSSIEMPAYNPKTYDSTNC